MTTAVRVTQAALDILAGASAGDADVEVTQVAIEVLFTPVAASANVTQGAIETLFTGADADVNVTTVHVEVFMALSAPSALPGFSAFIEMQVSGVSVVNAMGLTPFEVSFEYVDPGGSFTGGTFSWVFSDVGNEVGFVSTDTGSSVTRTYTAGGGQFEIRGITATISSTGGESNTTVFTVRPRAQQNPTPFDPNYQHEAQTKRRVWPT